MTTSEPMTEERLAKRLDLYRNMQFSTRESATAMVRFAAEDLASAITERARLRAELAAVTAENERLRPIVEDVVRAWEPYGGRGCTCASDTVMVGAPHSAFIHCRLQAAIAALNPEPQA